MNSALQRARKTVDERLPDRTQQETLRVLGDAKVTQVVEAYMDAMAAGDVERVVGMLAEDAAWSMPPLRAWFTGRDELRGFLQFGPLTGEWRWRHVATRANGQPAVGAYTWVEGEGTYLPFALDVLGLDVEGRLRDVTSFIVRSTAGEDAFYYEKWPRHPLDPGRAAAVFGRLGLPERLA